MANSFTVSVAQSDCDGFQTWSNRANANGLDVTTNLKYPLIGPHYNGSNMYASYFIFKFDNIPIGATVENCKLEVRTNDAYTGGLTNHIYVAVENNLNPQSSGLPTSGTLGSLPWQRLGRQSAATALFGNRCGPTHNKTGQSLSTYGAHVRDPSAMIYKAFCTDQTSASAVGKDLPANSWVTTEDFSAALQPLINDASWNPTTQYVMVYLFADLSSGVDYNIGSLASFTWDNGTVGAAGYGNGEGQIYFYDYNSGERAPRLKLTYSSSSLVSQNNYSKSSGNVRMTPALCLGVQRGERAELLNANAVIPIVSGGSHDLPFTGMDGVNPNDALWLDGNPVGARIKYGTQRTGRVDGKSILLEDFIILGNSFTPRIWWDINKYQNLYATRKVYSLRFYHKYDQGAWLNIYNNVVRFKLGNANVFRIEHNALRADPPNPNKESELRIIWPGGTSPWTNYQFKSLSGNNYYRYEIQVDESQNPKVRARVYLNDATVPLESFSANPSSVEIDRIEFGDFNTDAAVLNSRLSDVEIWSDYNLNRQFPADINNTVGTPYVAQKWEWFYKDTNGIVGLEDLGTISAIDGSGNSLSMTNPTDALTLEDHTSEIWTGGINPYIKHSNLSYGSGSGRSLDLYIPKGTPPSGGWPVIMYTHGGFWVSGSKSNIPKQFLDNLTIRGYAVASCEYVFGQIKPSGLGAYPSWNPNDATAKYPSFIINYKEAAYWLQTVGATLYNLNPLKFVASGHSAGGYNALGAVVSRGLTNDGSGRDLTLAGNVATFGSPNVPDPKFLGSYVMAAPVNLGQLKSWDPTHPNWPYLGLGAGSIHVTARVFMGQNADTGSGDTTNTNIDDMILLNPTAIPSICYAWSPSDFLVVSNRCTPYSQEKRLADTLSAVSGSLPNDTVYESHEMPDALHHTIQDVDFDFQYMIRWLKNLPGLW